MDKKKVKLKQITFNKSKIVNYIKKLLIFKFI